MPQDTAEIRFTIPTIGGPNAWKASMKINIAPWNRFADHMLRRSPTILREGRVIIAHEVGKLAVIQVQTVLDTEPLNPGDTLETSWTGNLRNSIIYKITPAGQVVQVMSTAHYAAKMDMLGVPAGLIPAMDNPRARTLVETAMGISRANEHKKKRGYVGPEGIGDIGVVGQDIIRWARSKLGVDHPRQMMAILFKINRVGVRPKNFMSYSLNDPEWLNMLDLFLKYRFGVLFSEMMPRSGSGTAS